MDFSDEANVHITWTGPARAPWGLRVMEQDGAGTWLPIESTGLPRGTMAPASYGQGSWFDVTDPPTVEDVLGGAALPAPWAGEAPYRVQAIDKVGHLIGNPLSLAWGQVQN